MSKIALSPNVSGTGVFTIASPNGNTDRTLTLPDEAGTVLTSGSPTVLPKGVPAFRAWMSNGGSDLSVSVATFTKIPFDTINFDTHSFFDNTTNYRFQPTIAGYYFFSAALYITYTGTIGNSSYLGLYKNGTNAAYSRNAGYNHYGIIKVTDLIYLNGSSDYVDAYGFYGGGSNFYFADGSYYTFLSGHLVRAD